MCAGLETENIGESLRLEDLVPWMATATKGRMELMETRKIVRWSAAGLSGITALLYLLIGLNVVSIGEITPEEQTAFALPAAAVFLGGLIVALLWDKRWLWLVGALGLTLIIVMYFNLASQRVPDYEVWGILIRVVQVPLLVSLLYLGFTTPGEKPAPREDDAVLSTSRR